MAKKNCICIFSTQKEEKWERFEDAAQDGTDKFYSWESSPSRNKLKSHKLAGAQEEEARYREAVTAVKLEPEPLEKYKLDADRRRVVEGYKKSVLGLLGLKKLQVA